jgi:outer membrane receptor protein involved in Fe transport
MRFQKVNPFIRKMANRPGPFWRKVLFAGLLLLVAGSVRAVDTNRISVADLSLEDLVNLKVTSVSKKEEKLNDAAAAIFVLSNDDLRRSGATSVADALRLVPGLQVAAIDSSTWAISARGFNDQFAGKLLVMIDGRAVYSPLFSGVYWDAQQMLLDDVDRIEVIRGPGGTLWGANAVNGVISIISKSARETQGSLVYGGGGDLHLALSGARYGGKIGEDTYYRIYGTYQLNDDFRQANGRTANDNWDIGKGGFRIDHYTSNDGHLTWQGDGYAGNLADRTGDLYGFNTLGRWTQPISDRSSYEVQAFFGGEAVLTVAATDSWRLSASYSFLMMDMQGDFLSSAKPLELNAPTHQAVLRSSYDFSRHASLDAQLRYVDNVRAVPAYVTADLRLSYRPRTNLELSIVGQNLLDDRHPEQAGSLGQPTFEVPRGFYGRIT